MHRDGDSDTICALSTPPGSGGIAVIRVSGPHALSYSRKIAPFLPQHAESHRVYYGVLRTSEPIDEVLISYFSKGRSFTGEETVEISCHGSSVISSTILKELVFSGCRLARRGEFTYRAFMSGRLDLVQAESVLGLIESKSKQSARISLRQLQGHLSQDFAKLEDDLVWILAHLEASIDFSTEDIEVVDQSVLLNRIGAVENKTRQLLESYRKGRILREGLEVALVGKPNAGKSSLLNALVGEERAIVTPHAGTTRDTIEGQVSYGGVPVTFVDTAGLRETDNEIEKLGIQRSKAAIEKADFVFHVLDLFESDISTSWISDVRERDSYVLVNKVDLDGDGTQRKRLEPHLSGVRADHIFWVSAKSRAGLDQVEKLIASVGLELDSESSNVVTQARHSELLQKIHSCAESALSLINEASSPEFIAFELQDAVRAIHELLGKEFDEQVIDRIFKEFCLGK